jgi:glycosyltransferase involved in cell wall biosynthesis
VLALPSWYATKSNFFGGAFFMEQSNFLAENKVADIKVLYGEKKSTPLLKFVFTFLNVLLFNRLKVEPDFIITPPVGIAFIIPNNRRVPDFLLLKLEKRMFMLGYDQFTKKYWTPDVVHCQSGMDSSIFANIFNKKFKIPFVITEQQVFVFHYYSRLRAKLILDAFKNASKIGAGSFGERTQILINQPDCNPCIIWNLVREDKFDIDLSKRDSKFTVITLLNSLPIKGYNTFLEAMKELSTFGLDFSFIMIGRGGNQIGPNAKDSTFVEYAKQIGVYELGEFLPVVPREKIRDVFNRAHVFVAPTIFEPFGIAVREAMMCGLPIVSTANGGVEDSISEETGVLVPVKDPKAMAEAILEVSENLEKYNPRTIREYAVRQCGSAAYLNAMAKFYNVK